MHRLREPFATVRRVVVAARLCAFVVLTGQVAAGGAVREKEVEAVGSAATEHEAISSALANAVGMVNGVSIDSRQWMVAFQEAIESNEGGSYVFEEASGLDIATLTKGTISSYEVVSTNSHAVGGFEARVRATVAIFQRGQSANRKRIAVLPMHWRDNYTIVGTKINPLAMAEVVEQAIVDELVDSRRFTVLDRRYLEQASGEMALIETGDVPVADLVRLGQTLAADYVLVGTLENVTGASSTRRMRTRDVEVQDLNVNAQLSYRVIDPATKQVKFSRTESMVFGDHDLQTVGTSSTTEPIVIAVGVGKLLGRTAGMMVTEAIYPIMVMAVTNSAVVLGQGGESMVVGTSLDLFRLGERMIDPYTKESIGRVEEWVGTVEITRATNKQSYARLVKVADIDLREHFEPKTFIARRPVGYDERPALVDKQTERVRRSREKRDNEQEALW